MISIPPPLPCSADSFRFSRPLDWRPAKRVVPLMLLANICGMAVVLRLCAVLQAAGILALPPHPHFAGWPAAKLFVVLSGFVPIFETLVFQFLVFELTHRFSRNPRLPFFLSWAAFCAVHFSNSIQSGLAAGLVGGATFGITYHVFRKRSRLMAFGATCIQHSIWNAGIVLVLLASRSVSSVPHGGA